MFYADFFIFFKCSGNVLASAKSICINLIKGGKEMKKISILTCMIFTFIVSVLLSGVQNLKADGLNKKLNGTYAVTSVITCKTNAQEYIATFHFQGLFTFYGDGNGEAEEITVLVMSYAPSPPSPYLVFLTGAFSYTVESNDYFTIDDLDLYRNGALVVEDIIQEGWIGHGSQTLILSDTYLNDETAPSGSRKCGRTGTAVKISKN